VGYAALVDVHLILIRDGHLLLAERANTGFADGQLNLPSGKLEPGEDVRGAIVREAREEIGLVLDPAAVRLVCVVHYRLAGHEPRIGCFFIADAWSGEPINAEPHKCAGLTWVDPARLPEHTVDYCAAGIRAYLDGVSYAAPGWPAESDQQ
jgi:8-oxo-dGTP pyrophosphatase MutT (NUDIX family)